jgi:glucose-1-phosphate cytidylyltransferase
MQIGKVVILAGGLGARLMEETESRPKPMVEIGGHPIIWHIMKIYSKFGLNDFVICLGYKGYMIKEFFANYYMHMADITIDLGRNDLLVHRGQAEPWRVTLVDTGLTTATGGRIRRAAPYIGDEPFCLTYGDGLADIDIDALLAIHEGHGRLATLTAVSPPGRFGHLRVADGGLVERFDEKPAGEGGIINGGFMVLAPEVIDLIDSDDTPFEGEPLSRLARDDNLHAYRHNGFWQPMDTLRDKRFLETLWNDGTAPWMR